MILRLFTREILDRYSQDNFQRLTNYINAEPVLKGRFKFFTYTFTGAVTNEKILHHLGFQPKDVLQTSLTGAGTITWNYDRFDVNYINVTTTGPCVVRAFLGSYAEGN